MTKSDYSAISEAILAHKDYTSQHNFRLSVEGKDCFVKVNKLSNISVLQAEAEMLKKISHTKTIAVPTVQVIGTVEDCSYMVLEWLDLHPLNDKVAATLGEQLALMHRHTHEQFGWYRDNTIGLSLQINTQSIEWIDFWKTHRLGFQLKLAAKNGYHGKIERLGAQLLDQCSALFLNYDPVPSLLHGDLWHGNAGSIHLDKPVIFDPAGYYGDRETDLAMASLFGGFPNSFFSAYNATWPLDIGYNVRIDFYNIYHLLNHLNIFGKSYLQQVERAMESVLSNIR